MLVVLKHLTTLIRTKTKHMSQFRIYLYFIYLKCFSHLIWLTVTALIMRPSCYLSHFTLLLV